MHRFPLLALVFLLAAGCGESSAPLSAPFAPGTYRLASVSGRAVPTTAPCGVFQIVEGSLTLGPGSAAEHRLRYSEIGTGREIAYEGAGSFRNETDGVQVELTGRWSHDPQVFRNSVHFLRAQGGLTRVTGQECDAAEVELYRAP